jgi:hypothetical protein
MGYRASEVPLVREHSNRGEVRVGAKAPRQRSVNFEQLDAVPDIPTMAPLSVDRYDKDTAIQGIRKRYAKPVPVPDPTMMRGFRTFCRRWARDNLPVLGEVLDFESWLLTTSYNDARKQQLRETHDRYLLQGQMTDKTARKLHRVKAFLKLESYPQYKHARHINARCDLAKCIFGPVIKSMEQEVYKLPQFIKHVPLPQRPALIRAMKRSGCRYVASDHTAFEAHFTKEIMNVIEFEVTRHMLSKFQRIEEILEMTEAGENDISVGSVDIRVLISGMRCSGDMWTSLFNGLGNLLSFLYACEITGCRFVEGYVEGDDGIFAIQGEPPTKELMEKLGFEVKFEVHDDPATASFCGLVLAGNDIIRDPVKFFMNFGWSDSFIGAGPKVKRQLALAKSLSALYETPGCPLVAVAANYVYNQTRGTIPRFIDGAYKETPRDYQPPPIVIADGTRELFARLYGISPAAQVDLEREISQGRWDVLATLNAHDHVRDYSAKYVEST